MTHLVVQSVEKKFVQNLPVVRTGYTVKVHQKIKEGEKERVQIFQGLVIAVSPGHGASKTITVRKEVEGIGVEKIFPLASTNVVKIEIVRTAAVRRAKLFYMRKLKGKSARLKEKIGLTEKDAKFYGTKAAKLAKEMSEEESKKQAEQLKGEMVKNMEAENAEKENKNAEPAVQEVVAPENTAPVSNEPTPENTGTETAVNPEGSTAENAHEPSEPNIGKETPKTE